MIKEISLEHITRIEGHAKLTIKVEKGTVKDASIDVFEGARFFEAILKGRKFDEAPHLSSRICGICSQSHLLTSIKAVEESLGLRATRQTELLREMLLIGQLIQSHVLHLYFLVLPDYFGFDNPIKMAARHPETIKKALRAKRMANDMVEIIGGREVHSITPIVGGFSKLPNKRDMETIGEDLREIKKFSLNTSRLFNSLEYPEFERKTEYIALQRENEYALLHGNLASTEGLFVTHDRYKDYLTEMVKESSTSKFVLSEGHGYMVGALARMNNNGKMLSRDVKELIKEFRMDLPNHSPFMINLAQALELVHLCDRGLEILRELDLKEEKPQRVDIQAGKGVSATEVPRGILFHEYEIDNDGIIQHANIITPTTQNLKNIEEDIREFLPTQMDREENEIIRNVEMLVRSYDPCISCSTHVVRL